MENDDVDTILKTTFDAGSSQHQPQMPVHTSPFRCQSTPPRTGAVRMQETPVPTVPVASQRLMTPRIPLPRPQDSNTSLSTMSAPLFTEDRCSSISNDDIKACDAEVMLINRRNKPNQTFTTHSTGGRPTSTPSTMDYTTRVIQTRYHQYISTQHKPPHKINYPIPITFSFQMAATGTFTRLKIKVFHARYLENGNNAYLLELHTSKFIMDEMSGQFYAV